MKFPTEDVRYARHGRVFLGGSCLFLGALALILGLRGQPVLLFFSIVIFLYAPRHFLERIVLTSDTVYYRQALTGSGSVPLSTVSHYTVRHSRLYQDMILWSGDTRVCTVAYSADLANLLHAHGAQAR